MISYTPQFSLAASRIHHSYINFLALYLANARVQLPKLCQQLTIFVHEADHAILVATDVAAEGVDIPGVRTVVRYQLPHSAEVYVHRSGRTTRAFTDGCSIALISSNDTSKFASLCKSFSRESFQRFPFEESSYLPEVMRRLSPTRQIDKITRKDSQEKERKTWFERNADSVELMVENDDSEKERELNSLLSRPLQPKSVSHRYLAGCPNLIPPVPSLQYLVHLVYTSGRIKAGRPAVLFIKESSWQPLDRPVLILQKLKAHHVTGNFENALKAFLTLVLILKMCLIGISKEIQIVHICHPLSFHIVWFLASIIALYPVLRICEDPYLKLARTCNVNVIDSNQAVSPNN
ncbi:hypothetical protein D5086_016957 [Populus alba]|uniref:Uncharacterized protein n=1 Tax=Populus alba TaxID=43335 RepID=A0ACC4BW18_POPAL